MKLSLVRTVTALAPACLSLSVAAALVFALPAAAQDKKPPAPPAATPPAPPAAPVDPSTVVVAIVNGQKIMLSEVVSAQANLSAQYRQLPLQLIFPQLLDQVIDGKLVSVEGRKANLQNDPDVKRRLALVEDQLIQQAYLLKEIDKKITPEALKARYDKFIKDTPPEEEGHARHILVKTEDEAKAIIADLKKGAAFDKLAKEKSTDKASGAEGGDLGWFKKSDMVKEFADAAFALNKGDLTETPVKTQFGYHVIKVEDRRKAPPPAFEELADQLREEMSREAVTAQLDQLRSGAKIEKFNMDGSKVEAKPAAPAAPATPARPPAAAPATPPAATK
jgi:peptidyl-prolyl cis-trans isomerase C